MTRVTPIAGEPLRFHVSSDHRQGDYLVDLEEFNFNGQCSCQHFDFRLRPLLNAGAGPSDAYRCKHIKAARSALLDQLMTGIAARVYDTRNTKGPRHETAQANQPD